MGKNMVASQPIVRGNQPHILPGRQGDALIEIANVPEIGLIANVLHARIAKGRSHLRGVIRGAIVHDQNFKILVRLTEDRIDALWQQMGELVARNNETHERVHWTLAKQMGSDMLAQPMKLTHGSVRAAVDVRHARSFLRKTSSST